MKLVLELYDSFASILIIKQLQISEFFKCFQINFVFEVFMFGDLIFVDKFGHQYFKKYILYRSFSLSTFGFVI